MHIDSKSSSGSDKYKVSQDYLTALGSNLILTDYRFVRFLQSICVCMQNCPKNKTYMIVGFLL